MAIATNDNVVQYPEPSPNAWPEVDHVGLWTAATGGTFLGGGDLTTAVTPGAGDDVRFAVGDLDIVLTTAGISTMGEIRALQGYVGSTGSVYVSLHSGDPGETGANEINGNAYARVAVAVSDLTIS